MPNEAMQAVVCHAPYDYRVEELPRPTPEPGEILIKVGSAGICASDMTCFTGGDLFWKTTGWHCNAPVIPGHEFAGVIAELGEGAAERRDVQIGDHVIAEQIVPCGRCRFCRDGAYWMCEPHVTFGFNRDGGMAEYMIFPPNARVHQITGGVSRQQAAYIEPLACAMHAVDRAEIKPGYTVVIAGTGNIGLCALQAAQRFNPSQIIALDTKRTRLELALQLGADVAINPLEEDASARVQQLTDGYGCDVYIEMSGNSAAPQQGLDMIRRLGTLVAFSVLKEPATINWTVVGDQKELNVHGSHLGPYCYPKAIAAIADGNIDVASLISAEFPLGEFDAAMEAARSGNNLKTLVTP
jgi:threonine dehydrogenase-like Zn-dependent dehydrogenase